jgi:hypothetical protein
MAIAMGTTKGSPSRTPEDEDEEEDEEEASPPKVGAPPMPSGSSIARALAKFLLLFTGALVVLTLVSVFVVYATALAARRFGVPELHVAGTFIALLALVVIGFLGFHIAGAVDAAGRQTASAVEDAGERVADEVDDAAQALIEVIEDVPAVIVDPRGGRSASSRRKQSR